MHKGEISNQFSPAIAIDVDDLIIMEKKKFFGLKKELLLVPGAARVLEYLFRKDLSVYLISMQGSQAEAVSVRELLDDMYVPYTRFYWHRELLSLEETLSSSNILWYFYSKGEHNPPARVSQKGVQITSLGGVSRYL